MDEEIVDVLFVDFTCYIFREHISQIRFGHYKNNLDVPINNVLTYKMVSSIDMASVLRSGCVLSNKYRTNIVDVYNDWFFHF